MLALVRLLLRSILAALLGGMLGFVLAGAYADALTLLSPALVTAAYVGAASRGAP